MRYELVRLILLLRDRDLFTPAQQPSRERWLRKIFAEEIVFQHYGTQFHYVPEHAVPDIQLIIGRIGRSRPVVENEPPEAGMHEIERESWIAAGIAIDPTSHEDGQKAAVEENLRVGNTSAIFTSLIRSVNDRSEEPYIIEANPIVDPQTFWDFERENRGEITSVTFDLFAPNMFGLRHELDKELAELRDNERVREAKLVLENKDGLKLDTERTRQTVEYALEGGGNIKARTKKKKRYNSKKKTKKITVEEADDKGFIDRMGTALRRLFAP